jgi:hypothetical protein
MLFAPSQATGMAIKAPSSVASVAISTVSSAGSHISFRMEASKSMKRSAAFHTPGSVMRLQSVSPTTMASTLQATTAAISP